MAPNSLNDLNFQSKNFTVVVVTDHTLSTLVDVDLLCRKAGIPLVAGLVEGAAGFVFNDFQSDFRATDGAGDESREVRRHYYT